MSRKAGDYSYCNENNKVVMGYLKRKHLYEKITLPVECIGRVKVYLNDDIVDDSEHKICFRFREYACSGNACWEVDMRDPVSGNLNLNLKYQSFSAGYAIFQYRDDFLEIRDTQDDDEVIVQIRI